MISYINNPNMTTSKPWINTSKGRLVIQIFIDGLLIKTTYYARLLMEQHLHRELTIDEVVHHKNSNKLDDRLENLEILTPTEHITTHNRASGIIHNLVCPVCKLDFDVTERELNRRLKETNKKNHSNMFCDRQCYELSRSMLGKYLMLLPAQQVTYAK